MIDFFHLIANMPPVALTAKQQAMQDFGDAAAEWLEARLDRDRQLRCIDRIRRAFFHPVPGGLEPIPHRVYWGLGWWRSGSARRVPRYPPAPFGWRWLKEPYRNAAVLLPLWLYWPAYVRRYWQSLVFPALMRLGLWVVDVEGGYYIKDGRPTLPRWLRSFLWCFLNDQDRAPDRM